MESMPLTPVTTSVISIEKAFSNGSANVSVVAKRFLEVEVSKEVVNEDDTM